MSGEGGPAGAGGGVAADGSVAEKIVEVPARVVSGAQMAKAAFVVPLEGGAVALVDGVRGTYRPADVFPSLDAALPLLRERLRLEDIGPEIDEVAGMTRFVRRCLDNHRRLGSSDAAALAGWMRLALSTWDLVMGTEKRERADG